MVTLLNGKTASAHNKIGSWLLLTLTKDCCSMMQSALDTKHDHQAFTERKHVPGNAALNAKVSVIMLG